MIERFHEVETVEKKRNPLSRLAGAFVQGAEEEGDTAAYLEEARWGHSILNVYAGKPEQAERISEVLSRHHAHTIKYFGTWTITNFPTPNE